MIRVHVFCEGQTEDTFVRELLRPHFARIGIWLNPIIIRTGPQGKGGVVTYGKIKRQVERKCKEDPTAMVSTLLDFYGLPKDFPGMTVAGNSLERAKAAETAFQDDIAQQNFIANLVVHEFEGLLFSSPNAFAGWFDAPGVVPALTLVRAEFASPEHINDGRVTAPSKRILAVCADYDKVLHGSLIALDIGLEAIRGECPRFDEWVKRIESLAGHDVA